MAEPTQLVAVRVAEIGAIVMGVVLGPQAGSPSDDPRGPAPRRAPGARPARGCQKSHHLPVSRRMGLLVVGPADQEQRARVRSRLPARPRPAGIDKPGLNAQGALGRTGGELQRALEVADADKICENMRFLPGETPAWCRHPDHACNAGPPIGRPLKAWV